jgi:hypothetical protein
LEAGQTGSRNRFLSGAAEPRIHEQSDKKSGYLVLLAISSVFTAIRRLNDRAAAFVRRQRSGANPMGFFKRLFQKAEPQSAGAAYAGAGTQEDKDSILDEAEKFVLDLWNKQRSLVRQAVFWNARNEISVAGFTTAASRDAMLGELRDSAKNREPQRVFFFFESSATAPDGRDVDVIVVEVGDAQLDFYGQRIYSAAEEPKQLAEETTTLSESPFAGLFKSG